MSNTWHDRAQKITRKERIMRKTIIITVAVLAALTLIGAPSAAADRQGVWLTGHVQNLGWGDPNPDFVGTTGQSLRLEAIQVRGRFAPVWCQAHVENLGWLPPVRDGEVCGTTGRALRLEAVRLWTE